MQLVAMAYFEEADEDGPASWGFNLGFYDARDFWVTKEGVLVSPPDQWFLVTDP